MNDSSRQKTAGSLSHRENGVVLIALLWIFIALSAIALSFARESRVEITAALNAESLDKAYYIARAGISETIYRLVHQRISTRPRQPGLEDEPTPLELGRITGEFGGGHYQVNIQDESGKINLNSVSEQQLRALLLATGIPTNDADTITDSIIDWRDEDDAHHMNGAEDGYYQALNPPYSSKDGRIDTTEELLLVRGVTPEYFYGKPEKNEDGSIVYKYGLSRYLTVYTARNQININSRNPININYAPLPVLLSIPGMLPEIAEMIYERRQTKPFQTTGDISREIPGMLGAETISYLTTQPTGIYTLNVSAYAMNSKVRRVIRTVISLDGSQEDFHRILYWNESVPDYEGGTL